jgi:hypothetical protein
MVWADSWYIRGWEMMERFVRKWGFILRDCDEFSRRVIGGGGAGARRNWCLNLN